MTAKEELLDFILTLNEEQVNKILRELSKHDEFIHFLRFSAEHLNRGDTVQEVWNEYQRSVAPENEVPLPKHA